MAALLSSWLGAFVVLAGQGLIMIHDSIHPAAEAATGFEGAISYARSIFGVKSDASCNKPLVERIPD